MEDALHSFYAFYLFDPCFLIFLGRCFVFQRHVVNLFCRQFYIIVLNVIVLLKIERALLVARVREDNKLVNALARFARQIHDSRQCWFRQLSSEAFKQRFAHMLETRFHI